MRNRPIWFVRICPDRARIPRADASPARTFGLSPKQSFFKKRISDHWITQEKFTTARRARQHAGRVHYPIGFAALVVLTPLITRAQEPPASVSVITSKDLEQKQIERVSDALREVPGLSVVQTGTAGQLTSVFTRGLRSEHTQVLLDGVPINQGLQGAFNFADLTIDDIDRIEIVRGPQSTLYGPRALAGVIQIFTKQGTGTPGAMVAAEG